MPTQLRILTETLKARMRAKIRLAFRTKVKMRIKLSIVDAICERKISRISGRIVTPRTSPLIPPLLQRMCFILLGCGFAPNTYEAKDLSQASLIGGFLGLLMETPRKELR